MTAEPRTVPGAESTDGAGQSVVDGLVRLLDLEPIEENIFRGLSPNVSLQRVFGGQVAGQALVAAGRTVSQDRSVHSLHSYFIGPGDPAVPIVYTVDRLRDGRSFSIRRVTAVQHGEPIFVLSASFQLAQGGIDHQTPMPDVPPPESLPTIDERCQGYDHVCALTFASDLTLLESVLVHHGLAWGIDPVISASLDHAMWFHRPFRADEWFLYDMSSPSASGGRGLAMGQLYAKDGRHIASVVQEGMMRVPSA